MLSLLSHIRAYLLIPFIVIHTTFCSIVVISLLLLRAPRAWVDFVIGPVWCGAMVRASGLQVQAHGIENVPKDRGFLYLFTHSSHLDIPTLFHVSPKSFRFGAKASLFKIPIFGFAVTLSGTLPITREDRNKVMEVYRQAEKRVAQGEAFALAPEGGRRRGHEILDFKSGPFIFAMNARMPIVPVVLQGVDGALKKGSLLINKNTWKRRVAVSFLPSRELPGALSREQLQAYKTQLRQEMVSEFNRLEKTLMDV